MLIRRSFVATATAVLLVTVGSAPAVGSVPTKRYRNCKALNRVYPHGVGRPGARDKSSGRRVTTFRV